MFFSVHFVYVIFRVKTDKASLGFIIWHLLVSPIQTFDLTSEDYQMANINAKTDYSWNHLIGNALVFDSWSSVNRWWNENRLGWQTWPKWLKTAINIKKWFGRTVAFFKRLSLKKRIFLLEIAIPIIFRAMQVKVGLSRSSTLITHFYRSWPNLYINRFSKKFCQVFH